MGNIVITITWNSHPDNELVKSKLRKLAINNGLSPDTDPNYAYGNTHSDTCFIADISGIFLA